MYFILVLVPFRRGRKELRLREVIELVRVTLQDRASQDLISDSANSATLPSHRLKHHYRFRDLYMSCT